VEARVRVVGIGASAGGLEAFLELVSAIQSDSGLAFVVVQHLDPRHDSLLTDLLAGAAGIPVVEIQDGMAVAPDRVYVIPQDTLLTIRGGVLHLSARTNAVPNRPIDDFFRSLALDAEGEAIGVVLSGNDADGAAGLEAIRDAGGITFAQSAESAKFDVMPRAAARAADFILTPAEIAAQLQIVARQASGEPGDEQSLAFDRILHRLRVDHPVDFHHFKRASVERRILRRVLLGGHAGVGGYADFLEGDRSGVETLYQDLLIGVTSFFRDPERFEALQAAVLPSLVQRRNRTDEIRLWVAGCSTGEEVYSLAITMLEFLDGRPGAPPLSIYGTDINEASLKKARSGFYTESALSKVSPERLARFFTATADGYKVNRNVRELCVFASHDVTRDPPFSRIDLLTCCNVLIYFDAVMQKKTIALLEYALAPGGFLMLGSSESLRGNTHLTAVSTKPLIYRKRSSPAVAGIEQPPLATRSAAVTIPPAAQNSSRAADEANFLASRLASSAVLVNSRMEIVRFRGEVAPFIALEPGDASLDLFHLIRHHEVLAELRPAIRLAMKDGTMVTRCDIRVRDGATGVAVTFDVIPTDGAQADGSCWVVFRNVTAAPYSEPGAPDEGEIAGLRRALAAAIHDREQLADEAASAAEEAQSSDEELRSTNEEMETAREELQSANEELSTLNDELRVRNDSLVTINDDIENLLGAVEIPILFVGTDLLVRRYNVSAGLLLNLRPDVREHRLRALKSSLDTRHLETLVGAVIATSAPADVEVQEATGEWRLLRIRAYRTSDGKVDGAIVAVLDIDALKRSVLRAEEATRAANMLSHAGALLTSSLDYEATLASVARLSNTDFSDWCAVDLLDDSGAPRPLTVFHANPVLRDLVIQFQEAAFHEVEDAPGAPRALREETSVLLADFTDWLQQGPRHSEKLIDLAAALAVRSLISVPLIARQKTLGTITFASSRRCYEQTDLRLAEELAQRAAVAIDTAGLFRDAEHANRYKDEFLGTVAHELRTPLTSIIGWVQLAKKNPEAQGDAITRIDESAALLRTFVEDLLDVTRIREQKLSVELDDIDLATIVRSAVEMTAFSATAGGIDLRCHISLDPAPLRADGVRMRQVIWNLISNAIKFTPAGGSIDLRLERSGNDARFAVTDTGTGIAADFLPHVFELYRQASGTGPGSRGLGIGLSIVSQIVRLHGGSVRAESDGPGRGSTFVVSIPLLASGAHAIPPPLLDSAAGQAS
jgi:two-component system CheB/CheR fusion protein